MLNVRSILEMKSKQLASRSGSLGAFFYFKNHFNFKIAVLHLKVVIGPHPVQPAAIAVSVFGSAKGKYLTFSWGDLISPF